MPYKLNSVPEAFTAFIRIVELSKGSLEKILVRSEFDEYPYNRNMHCTARLAEMLRVFSEELKTGSGKIFSAIFLKDEIEVLKETKGIELPNFLSRSAFHTLLRQKIEAISEMPVRFVTKVWDYVETIVVEVLRHHSENYPQLQLSTRRAAQNLVSKMRERSTDRVMEIVEMEKHADYTCDPQYVTVWSRLMESQGAFEKILSDTGSGKLNIEGFGEIEVCPFRDDPPGIREEAFDLKMRITAYWKIVHKRMVDCIALQLLLSIHRLVNGEMEKEVTHEVMGPQGDGVERLLEESPSVATKRGRLNQSISLLKESRDVLATIMDRIL